MTVQDSEMNAASSSKPDKMERERANRAQKVSVIAGLMMALLTVAMAVIVFRDPIWQFFVILSGFLCATLSAIEAYRLVSARRIGLGIGLILASGQVALLLVGFLVEGLGLVVGLATLILAILVSSATLTVKQSNLAILVAIPAGIAVLLIDTFSVFNRLSVPRLETFTPFILGVLMLTFFLLMARQLMATTLQIKLVVAVLGLVLVPLSIVAVLGVNNMRSAVTHQTYQSLSAAAIQTATEVDNFITLNLNSVNVTAQLPVMVDYLSKRSHGSYEISSKINLDDAVRSLALGDQTGFDSLALLDTTGTNVYDTLGYPNQPVVDELGYDYFTAAMTTNTPYVSQVEIFRASGKTGITFSRAIYALTGERIGVLRIRYKAEVLQSLLSQNVGLIGQSSHPILFDANLIRLADPLNANELSRSLVPLAPERVALLQKLGQLPNLPADQLTTNELDFSQKLNDRLNAPQFTVTSGSNSQTTEAAMVADLKTMPWFVVFLQDEGAFLAPVNQQAQLVTLASAIVAGLAAIIAVLIAHLLTSPIGDLTATAQRITGGNLNARVDVNTSDEIGILGNAFNMMTGQLRGLINNLERRVEERTRNLQEQKEHLRHRATQLQTVSDVARAITSVQDLEELLTEVTRLISDRFGYYHVGVFLIDENRRFAVLRAANSEGGQRMLARGHRLKIGETGIVGYVSSVGEARIATDVGKDSVYFDNPDLPSTRSEMALPLRLGEQIIGALDIQSTAPSAFTEEDVSLFNTLADQVAVAIVNNSLYAETRRALAQSEELHRQYLQQEWKRELEDRPNPGYLFSPLGAVPLEAKEMPEVREVLESGETLVTTAPPEAASRSTLAVPIKLRGQVIGVLGLQETENGRTWSPEEIDMVQAVADQVAQAIENVRLFEQTVRRADRERKVIEITGKIRAAKDPQEMLRTAVEELQRTLHASRAQIVLQPAPQEIQGPPNGKHGQP